jgi:hypothetical protein
MPDPRLAEIVQKIRAGDNVTEEEMTIFRGATPGEISASPISAVDSSGGQPAPSLGQPAIPAAAPLQQEAPPARPPGQPEYYDAFLPTEALDAEGEARLLHIYRLAEDQGSRGVEVKGYRLSREELKFFQANEMWLPGVLKKDSERTGRAQPTGIREYPPGVQKLLHPELGKLESRVATTETVNPAAQRLEHEMLGRGNISMELGRQYQLLTEPFEATIGSAMSGISPLVNKLVPDSIMEAGIKAGRFVGNRIPGLRNFVDDGPVDSAAEDIKNEAEWQQNVARLERFQDDPTGYSRAILDRRKNQGKLDQFINELLLDTALTGGVGPARKLVGKAIKVTGPGAKKVADPARKGLNFLKTFEEMRVIRRGRVAEEALAGYGVGINPRGNIITAPRRTRVSENGRWPPTVTTTQQAENVRRYQKIDQSFATTDLTGRGITADMVRSTKRVEFPPEVERGLKLTYIDKPPGIAGAIGKSMNMLTSDEVARIYAVEKRLDAAIPSSMNTTANILRKMQKKMPTVASNVQRVVADARLLTSQVLADQPSLRFATKLSEIVHTYTGGSIAEHIAKLIKPVEWNHFYAELGNLNTVAARIPTQDAVTKMISGNQLDKVEKGLISKFMNERFGAGFGTEFIKALNAGQAPPGTLRIKGYDVGAKDVLEVVLIPRTLMTSVDFSAALMQGGVLGAGNARKWLSSVKPMVEATFKAESYEAFEAAARNDRWFRPATEVFGLVWDLPADATARMSARSDQFMSKFATKLPWVKGSERGFNTFLNKLRFDIFKQHADQMVKDGTLKWSRTVGEDGLVRLDPIANDKTWAALKDLANYLNTATGRGDFGKMFDTVGPMANVLLFSPKLLLSRFKLPFFIFGRGHSRLVRKMAAKDLLAFVVSRMSLLGVAAAAGIMAPNIVRVGTDTKSSEFGKIIFGNNVQVDMMAGYGALVRAVLQVQAGARTSTGSGQTIPMSARKTITRYLLSKLSPTAGTVYEGVAGETFMGEHVDYGNPLFLSKLGYELVTPLFVQDLIDISWNSGLMSGVVPSKVQRALEIGPEPEVNPGGIAGIVLGTPAALFGGQVSAFRTSQAKAVEFFDLPAGVTPERFELFVADPERMLGGRSVSEFLEDVEELTDQIFDMLKIRPLTLEDKQAFADKYDDIREAYQVHLDDEFEDLNMPPPDTSSEHSGERAIAEWNMIFAIGSPARVNGLMYRDKRRLLIEAWEARWAQDPEALQYAYRNTNTVPMPDLIKAVLSFTGKAGGDDWQMRNFERSERARQEYLTDQGYSQEIIQRSWEVFNMPEDRFDR